MKILVDMNHPVDVNFFKNALRLLARRHQCSIAITLRPRGKLVPILQNELPEFRFTPIGRYRRSLAGKVFGVAYHSLRLLTYARREGFDVVASFGGISASHVSYALRRPSVIFDDDIEYRLAFYPYWPFATRIVVPQHIPLQGKKVVKYKGFKELAYLHPNYFEPDEGALREYGLTAEKYVFIREVSGISSNYAHLQAGQLAGTCSHLRTLGLDVVLSLEDKSLADRFAPYCTILREPVRDIYSLMHFALFSVSSGDTMARESCLTGTPVIYTGGRYMSVNSDLIRKGVFFEANEESSVMSLVSSIIKENIKSETKEIVQKAMLNEWEDTTEVIVNNILTFARKDRASADLGSGHVG